MKVQEFTLFPRSSGPVDERILEPIRREILLKGKEANGVVELFSEELRVATTTRDHVVVMLDRETRISRAFVSSSVELDKLQGYLGDALYGCLVAFFSGGVPEQFFSELTQEVQNISSYLPQEKKKEIAFSARDEVGLDKILEGLKPEGGVA